MSIISREFGQIDGQAIKEYSLRNSQGLCIRVLNYGGIISEIHVPDRQGEFRDVVLGFNTLEEYLQDHPYFGCITGRVAGRITNASFTHNNQCYTLVKNDPPNHLHGGTHALDKKVWQAEESDNKLVLSYLSPAGEEGYPGNLQIHVSYELSDQNELIISYRAETDATTPISLTNHSYFNLAGEDSGDIRSQEIQIFADRYAKVDDFFSLTGEIGEVNEANDLRHSRQCNDFIPHLFKEHGDNYFLNKEPSALDNEPLAVQQAAVAYDPQSGRKMEVFTSDSCLQLYTSKFLDGSLIGKSGQAYQAFSGFCLECQDYPDGVNKPEIANIFLEPGQLYQQQTIYKFSVE